MPTNGEESSVAAFKSTYKRGKAENFRQRAVNGRTDRVTPADERRNRTDRGIPVNEGRNRRRGVICYNCGGKGHLRAQCPGFSGATTSHLECFTDETDVTTNAFSVHGVGGSTSKLGEVALMVKPGVSASTRYCPAVADTGAECCVAGTAQMKMLNLKLADLGKPDSKIRHAGGGALKILGVKKCMLQLANRTTTQKVYFIQGVERFFLSVDACKELKLVDKNFPHHIQDNVMTAAAVTTKRHTGPAARRPVPKRPNQIPFLPTEANVPQLEQYLKQQFADTTFNRETAPLPTMDCAPHTIHLLPDAVPFARHTPIPVSKHWEEEVKAQLDEDERMGIRKGACR